MIEPALTPEEWAIPYGFEPNSAGETADGTLCFTSPRGERWTVSGRKRHVHAALALHGQTFGFTREDVRTILDVALYEQVHGTYPDSSPFSDETLAVLKSMADRIAALLPFEEPPK